MSLSHLLINNASLKLLILFLSLWGTYVAAAEEALVWQFQTGDEHVLRTSQDTKMVKNLGVMGTKETHFQQTVDIFWKVEDVSSNGTATISQRIQRVQITIAAPGEIEMKYDSNDREAPTGYAAMLTPAMKLLLSSPITFSITPRGQVTAIQVPQKLSDSMNRLPGAKLITEMMTEQGLRGFLQSVTLVLPETEELQEGYQWSNRLEIEYPLLGKTTKQTTYEYMGPRTVDSNTLEVFQPQVATTFGSSSFPEGVSIQLKSQESNGEILFDRTLGRLSSSLLTNVMVLEIDNAGQTMEQIIDQTVKVSRLDEKATQPESTSEGED